jgi:hypothetical protein
MRSFGRVLASTIAADTMILVGAPVLAATTGECAAARVPQRSFLAARGRRIADAVTIAAAPSAPYAPKIN